ncbi:MAG: hypothetical protein MUO76_13475 [Anaerolineaceae bacterium]|nr:hypothetical protein [Anaerolineaceae bacterium]
MERTQLTEDQLQITHPSGRDQIFLEGPAGTGKTTAGVEYMLHLLNSGVPADSILILVPQRTLGLPYFNAIKRSKLPPGGIASVLTIGGLSQRMITLFWPLIVDSAGFGSQDRLPIFLNLETAQYYMAQLVRPMIDKGYFDSITIDPNRIFSQILDNLNKAASVGFSYATIGDRLKSAWVGKPEQIRVYDETQDCAHKFRNYCLENNLLDYSLQIELFYQNLWPMDEFRHYISRQYKHLIYDNIEEDVPVAHDIVHEWKEFLESTLMIYDLEGGYRTFLGADPQSGYRLKDDCPIQKTFFTTFVNPPELVIFKNILINALQKEYTIEPNPDILAGITISQHKYYPQMIDWVANEIGNLVFNLNTDPGDITILSPFLSDSLRYSLQNRLDNLQIPSISHRPSRSLRDEPATHCLLTLAKLSHPQWNFQLTQHDIRYMFMQAIDGFDIIRADLLARIVFRTRNLDNKLTRFDEINPDVQERISYTFGELFEQLNEWLSDYQSDDPIALDIFLGRLFGEILSQPGFGFHRDFDAAEIAAKLIDSVRTFRKTLNISSKEALESFGKEYIQMVDNGILASQHLESWSRSPEDAVFLVPAYTFLMANRPAKYQFWLDIGSMGWWERLNQPLTHPYVLSRHWDSNLKWTDNNEYRSNQEVLQRLVSGLVRRCTGRIYLCTTSLNEQGNDQRGPLLQALKIIKRKLAKFEADHV